MTVLAVGNGKIIKIEGAARTERNGNDISVIPIYNTVMKIFENDKFLTDVVGKYHLRADVFDQILEVD